MLEKGSSIIVGVVTVVVIEIGTTSHAQRDLPIHKIPGQTGARKTCSYELRQSVTTKATACEQNLSNDCVYKYNLNKWKYTKTNTTILRSIIEKKQMLGKTRSFTRTYAKTYAHMCVNMCMSVNQLVCLKSFMEAFRVYL